MDTVNNQDFSYLDNQNLALIPGFDDKLNNNLIDYPTFENVDITPQTKTIVGDIRNRANLDLFSGNGNDPLGDIIKQTTSKPSLSGGFSNIYDTHDRLNDGSFVAKYDDYLQGTDNNARMSAKQSSLERFFNPVIRGVTKVGRGIPLDIASFAYGVTDAVMKGRFESLYDNDFANWVDDLDKKTDNAYANYYNQNQDSLTNPTYLWDKTLGGAEFTARMIGSEALLAFASGGTSVVGSVGKMSLRGLGKVGRIAEALETAGTIARNVDRAGDVVEVGRKSSGILKNLLKPIGNSAGKGDKLISSVNQAENLMSGVNTSYKLKDNLKMARFAITGSAYEAGFEARHFENEAEQAFWTYHRNNGTIPTQDEVNSFYDKLDGQANKVFATNMGLLSVSNLALFGNMLNIKTPFGKAFGGINDKIGAKLFGQGIEEVGEKGVATAIKANIGQKALAYTSPVIKGIFTEGVFEEGGQGIASNMMKNYVASAYDPQAMKDTATYTDSFSKAFVDQFSTKEGLEEVIIGGIIGGLFGGVGGIQQTNRDYKKQNVKADVQTYINQNKELLYTDANLTSLFASTSRNATLQQQLDKAISENKTTESAMKQAETFISMLESANSVGKEGDMVKVLLDSLKGADNKLISERLGIDESLVDSFKDSQIEGVNSILDTYKTSRQFAENIFRGSIQGENAVTRENMISGLSYAMTMGKVAEMTANNLFDNVRNNIRDYFGESEIYSNLNTVEVLSKMSASETRQLSDLESNIKKLVEESKQKGLELSQLTLDRNSTKEYKTSNVNRQNQIQQELNSLNDNISDMRNKADLLKSSIISNFYSIKPNVVVSKEDLTDFQTKIDSLNTAVNNLSNKANAHEIVKSMQEFNQANLYYKQFSELANSFTNPELQYSTYNHIFSSKRTKNKKLNDFTKEFLDKASNVKRGFMSTYNGGIESEIESFDGTLKPSKALRNYLENKQEELTEKEQQVLDYINDEKNSFERLLERSNLLKRKKELEEKFAEIDSESLSNNEKIKSIDSEIEGIKNELQKELNNINNQLNSTKSFQEIKNNLDSFNTKEEKLNYLKNMGLLETFSNKDGKEYLYLKTATERVIVKIKLNDLVIPFYISTGLGDKSDVAVNKWYVFFGQGKQGWFNKTSGDEINNHYNSSEFAEVIEMLNSIGSNKDEYKERMQDGDGYLDLKSIADSETTLNTLIDGITPIQPIMGKDGLMKLTSEQRATLRSNIEYVVNKVKGATSKKSENYDLELKKNRLIQEAQDKIDDLENNKNSLSENEQETEDNIDDLTKREYAELQSINSELNANPMTAEEYNAQNELYKQEISAIYNDGEVDKTLKHLDAFYISDINSNVKLNEEQENRVNELLSLIRDNEMLIQSLKAPKFNNNDSLENQIKSFIDSNPIFSNEASPYYGTETFKQDEMNEFEVLRENTNRNEEEQERYEELLKKAERLVIEENLEFGGGTLLDLMNLKKQAETLTENSNETSTEVNERIFHESMQPILENERNGYASDYVSLVWDNSVASNGVIDGEDVTRIHNLRLENILNRFFNANPNEIIQFRELGSGDVISEVGINDFLEESKIYDNKSGIEIVFPNGERLLKPESSRDVTGSSFGYTGNINDFGLRRIVSPIGNSGFDVLYEVNSQDGYSQVKSDYEVTIKGIPLVFKPEIINNLKVGDKVDLVYLPEADYSIEANQSIDDSVIIIKYKGENVGILKASSDKWDTLRKKRESVIYNKEIKGVSITESYLGLPNIEYNSEGNIVTHDASNLKEIGYLKPNGEYVYLHGGKKSNVNTSLVDAVKNDGSITPFAVITFGNNKYAVPIIVDSITNDLSNLVEDIITKDINDAKKVYELNKMLNENNLYNSENKFDLERINQSAHISKIKDILANSEKLVNILDHDLYRKANKRIILDLNNPFGASKFKMDLKSIKEKPKNSVESGEVSKKLEKEGKEEAEKVTCKNKK